MAKKLPKGITLRKDGRYMWRFQYEGVSYSGYSKKLSEATKAMIDKRYEVEHGLSCKNNAITLDAWFDEWIETYKRGECKATSLENYKNMYSKNIHPYIGQCQLQKIHVSEIQKLLNRMADDYSKGVIHSTYLLLRSCLRQAVKNGLISVNPADNVTVPKGKVNPKKRAVSYDDEHLFLERAKDSRYYDLYKLASLTGMRLGEILGLQWSDIDLNNGIIHVTHTLSYKSGTGVYLDSPKSESSRRDIPVMVNGEVCNLLKDRQIELFHQRMLMGQRGEPKKGMENLVFTNPCGSPIRECMVDWDVKKITGKLCDDGYDFDRFTFHTLRHCFATRAIEAGMEPKVLQSILGHSTFAMTMDLYCDVMEGNKRSEMEKIQMAL